MDTAIVSVISTNNCLSSLIAQFCKQILNVDSSSYQQNLSLGHNCFNSMNDALCNAWKDKCFYDGINGSTTWRTYMKEKCQKTCGYCSGKFKKSAVYLLQVK